MKIEDAFIEQDLLLRQMRKIAERIGSMQESERRTTDIGEYYNQLYQSVERLEELGYAIDVTNMTTEIDGVTLQDKIIEYQLLRYKRLTLYKMLYEITFHTKYGVSKYDVFMMDPHKVEEMHTEYSSQLDNLYKELKFTNWKTELK
jgi:hypothetical protein